MPNKIVHPQKQRLLIPLFVLALVLLAWPTHTAHAATLTVCAGGCDYTTITAAITAAGNGDTILVTDAVHTEQGITINKSLTIQGQGAVNTTVQAAATQAAATDRVFFIETGHTVTFQHMTIQNGNINNDGGAISNSAGSTINIEHVVLTNNRVGFSSKGGALFNDGTAVIYASTISNNSAAFGGGIRNEASMSAGASLTIVNSTIHNNDASIGGGISNSGSFDYNSSITIVNSTLSNNEGRGGAIFHDLRGIGSITNSTITGNTATGSDNGGGIILNGASTLTLVRTIIAGNSAGGDGDEIYIAIGGSSLTANAQNVLGHNGLTAADAFTDVTVGASDVNGTSDNGNILLSNILDTTIQDNGGTTRTHALPTGSPAIDIATAANCSGSPLNGIDQRGAARSYGAGCDAGAVEARVVNEDCTLSTSTNSTISSLTFDITTIGTLACLKVEAMGNVNHLQTTPPIETGTWWHIYGEDSGGNRVTSGFDLAITFPYATADAGTRACKYPGDLGGFGWECDNGSNTSFVTNTSVTRSNISTFSDWAVGDNVGPTAVSGMHATADGVTESSRLPLLLTVVMGLGTAALIAAQRRSL